jgi:hypothetical protein
LLLAVLAAALVAAGSGFASAKSHTLAVEVRVTLSNGNFAMTPGTLSTQLSSFDVALVVVNRGTKPHVLTIRGPGLPGATSTKPGVQSERIGPGGSTTLRLKLGTGAYQVSDAVGSAHGTVHWLVVHPATTGSGGGTTPAAPTPTNPAFSGGNTATSSWMDCL